MWVLFNGGRGDRLANTYVLLLLGCQLRMVHTHLERLRIMLRSSRVKCAEAEAKLAEAVAAGNAKQTESDQRFHACDAKRRDAEAKLVQTEGGTVTIQDRRKRHG